MQWVALILFLLALVILWQAARKREETGLPTGRIVYDDSSDRRVFEEPLYDPYFDLTGKPDYILKKDGAWIPVEVKSSAAPSQPYDGHIFQLGVYCILVERTQGIRPPYGIIRYRNRSFAIDFTPELEADLVDAIEEIRAIQIESNKKRCAGPDRSHNNPPRCAKCGYREECNQPLL